MGFGYTNRFSWLKTQAKKEYAYFDVRKKSSAFRFNLFFVTAEDYRKRSKFLFKYYKGRV